VIVTPYLVNETARAKLKTPDEGVGMPSDRKAFLKGHVSTYDRHAARRPAHQPVREESWSVKDSAIESYKPQQKRRSERSWGQNRGREEGLGFIIE
jgi:Flp pilus assembly secretin CpaC